ncbi:hypothetical protein DAPPUDRAFT_315304 [Daphnia pulex]|uniref:Transposase (putative) YhgA-like domain-containing protein n=1 Tax=Daphnia pulex TaxID=6669 RepID=E9G9C8_DAPPU|nr:hypothetical protein DAPPUDRAFT_315304 [Daphnia pulex]|eukprot:EFX83902.1 hypothetical protein DAPPUDRAFT_315304 [Daphnia pulex]
MDLETLELHPESYVDDHLKLGVTDLLFSDAEISSGSDEGLAEEKPALQEVADLTEFSLKELRELQKSQSYCTIRTDFTKT